MCHSSDPGEREHHFPDGSDTKKTTKCIIWATLAVWLVNFRKKNPSKTALVFGTEAKIVKRKQIFMMATLR